MLSPDDLRCKYPESNPANIHVRAWYLACRQPREPHVQLPRSIKIDGKMTTRVVRCKDMNPLLTIVRNLLALGFTPTPEAEQSSLMHAAFHDFHTYENRYQWGSILKGQLLADLFPERELDTEFKDRHSNLCDLLSTAAGQTHIFQNPAFLLFDPEAKEPCKGGFRSIELSDAYNAQQSRLVYDGKRPLSESLSEFLDSRLCSHYPLMITVFPPFLRVCYDPASNEDSPTRRFDDLSTFTLRGWTRGPQPQGPQSPGSPGEEADTGPPVHQEHNYILFMVVAQVKSASMLAKSTVVRTYTIQLRPIIPQQPDLTYIPGAWRLGDPSHRYMLFYYRLDPDFKTDHLPPRPPLEVYEMSPEELLRLQTRPPPAASEMGLHEQDNIQPPKQGGPSPDLSSITPE